MTTKTRYFAIVSLVVLVVGLGSGMLAYYVGLPTSEAASLGGLDELQFVPADASLVAYADVRDVMTSAFGARVRTAFNSKGNDSSGFTDQTGISIETDIDRVVAAAVSSPDADQKAQGFGLVLARGRFDAVKIEALVRAHGGRVEDYKGRRLIVGDSPQRDRTFCLTFLETGLIAIGSTNIVKSAVDLVGGVSVATNQEIMQRIRVIDSSNAWVVGRFDDASAQAALPAGVGQQLRAMQWFSVSARVDSGLHGVVRAEARDEQSASDFRDLVRGGLALAKFQTAARPELEPLLRSLELGGTERTVALSFDMPAELLDVLGPLLSAARPPSQPGR